MTIEQKMSEFQKIFEPYLADFFKQKIIHTESPEEKQVWETMQEYVLVGGKRIRPFLLWQMLEETRTEIQGLSDVLVAFELLHNSTLIEDDIIDKHSIRRHKPTLPISLKRENLNGEHISLIAAGLMRCASLNLILNADISEKYKAECIDAYTRIATSVNEGQVMDLYWTGRLDISEENLLAQTEKVAARFIEYMFELGSNKETQKLWGEVGLHLGVVFQLVDALLDIDKNKDKGRPIGDDIRMGKSTPLIIFAYRNLPPESRTRFEQNFGNNNIKPKELNWIIKICETTGAITHVKELIRDRLSKVDSILSSIGVTRNHWIYELERFSVERIS